MIRFINKDISHFIAFLNNQYPTPQTVYIHILEGYDTVDTNKGKGFGVFRTDTKEIFVAGDMPDEQSLFETIAHEYYHFIESLRFNNKNYDEGKATRFAEHAYEKYKRIQEMWEFGRL